MDKREARRQAKALTALIMRREIEDGLLIASMMDEGRISDVDAERLLTACYELIYQWSDGTIVRL